MPPDIENFRVSPIGLIAEALFFALIICSRVECEDMESNDKYILAFSAPNVPPRPYLDSSDFCRAIIAIPSSSLSLIAFN